MPSNAIISPPNSFSICNHYYEFITIKEKIFTLRVCFDIIEPQGVISINGRRLSLSIAEGIYPPLYAHTQQERRVKIMEYATIVTLLIIMCIILSIKK
jgi:predicted SAM-dependent methyltransferase